MKKVPKVTERLSTPAKKIVPPEMEDFVDVKDVKNYEVQFKAVIEGVVYISAESKHKAAQIFKDDESKSFDRIQKFVDYKITNVKETA